MIAFEWDEDKNKTSQRKHGITFEEVESVFSDDLAILFDDPAHALAEERFLIIGVSNNNGICIVSHCYREDDGIIRIISARKATNAEQCVYRQNFN